MQSLRPGVVSATHLGFKYSPSSLDKLYGSYDDWPDPEPIVEEKRLLLGMLSGWIMTKCQCLAQYSFILCCELWLQITVFLILEPFVCEFWECVGSLKPLQCWISLCHQIHNRYYYASYVGFRQSIKWFRQPGVSIINIASIRCYMKVSFRTFKNTWNTYFHTYLRKTWSHGQHHVDSSIALCMKFWVCLHLLQIADRADGLPKTWSSLSQPDCSWIHLKPAEWCVPCMVCGFSMQATRFRRPQGLIIIHKLLSNLTMGHQS